MFVENGRLNRKGWTLLRASIAVLLTVIGVVLEHLLPSVIVYAWLGIYLPAYLLISYDVLWGLGIDIAHGKFFDEAMLMVIATIGAFAIGEYPEAVAVMILFQIGEMFQQIATEKSRKNIGQLMELRPEYANLVTSDGVEVVSPFDVNIDDTILVKVGERVPLDGVVIEGDSVVNTIALTGESLPQEVSVGSSIMSGVVNESSPIKVKVEKVFCDSVVSKILDMVENATNKKTAQEKFISKFAKYYTPFVVLLALIVGIVPGIVTGEWSVWIYRALSFLVISCPCALVISVPLSYFAGIGVAGKNGVLVKGSTYLESLAKASIVAMDKTGTITKGKFEISNINPVGVSQDELLQYVAMCESQSNHPIAKCVVASSNCDIDYDRISDWQEIVGYGVSCSIDGDKYIVGNAQLMTQNQIKMDTTSDIGCVLYVAKNGEYIGNIVMRDSIKDNAKDMISSLKQAGVKQVVMLTGDKENIAKSVASEVGLDGYVAGMLPQDKLEYITKLKQDNPNDQVVFVGDGVNDAPVLVSADIGISMGNIGSDSAVEASNIVVVNDDLSKIPESIRLAKHTNRIVLENIIFSIGIKLLVMILTGFGLASMWLAIFADVGVSVLAILNALRLFMYKAKYKK